MEQARVEWRPYIGRVARSVIRGRRCPRIPLALHAGYQSHQEATMSKIGIVGVGAVGCACAMAAVNRGSTREIVLVDRTRKRAEAVATDMRYGTPLGSKVTIAD